MTISVKIVLEQKEAHTLAVPPPSALKTIATALAVEIMNVTNVNAANNISVTNV
jgi:CRISPR-associated Cas5-like protein